MRQIKKNNWHNHILEHEALTSIENKDFPLTKVKLRAKDDKMRFQNDTLKAVDVTFLDVLVRQNDLVYAKIQLLMCFLRSKIFTFSKMLLTSIFDRKEQKIEKIKTNKEEQLA